jgi:hypothetical protein
VCIPTGLVGCNVGGGGAVWVEGGVLHLCGSAWGGHGGTHGCHHALEAAGAIIG